MSGQGQQLLPKDKVAPHPVTLSYLLTAVVLVSPVT